MAVTANRLQAMAMGRRRIVKAETMVVGCTEGALTGLIQDKPTAMTKP